MVAATADGHRVCVEGTHGAHAATLAQQDGLSQEQLQATTDIDVTRTALDLVIVVRATGERIVLEKQYVRDGQQNFAVEHLQRTTSSRQGCLVNRAIGTSCRQGSIAD